jgi:predicted DNA-binding protein
MYRSFGSCDTIYKMYRKGGDMPISLRLPENIEQQIAGYCAREGRSKSAVIVQSIQEFLAKNVEPSSLEIYEAAMLGTLTPKGVSSITEQEHRPLKLELRSAIQRKQLARSSRAIKAMDGSSNVVMKRTKSA